jgi:hypothetical protein
MSPRPRSIAIPVAQTIGQDHSQQIHRIGDLSRTQERFRLARRNIERFRPAKPGNNIRPVVVHKRFVSHHTLESQTIPRRKTILTPMGVRRDDVGRLRVARPVGSQ